MSSLLLQNIFKVSRRFFVSLIPKGKNFHMAGIIPGGGLGKLQGIKEEEYFARKDSKFFENMKDRITDFRHFEYENTLGENPTYKSDTCSVKHKNLLEEAYFLSEHCDCLKLLKTKFKEQDESEN